MASQIRSGKKSKVLQNTKQDTTEAIVRLVLPSMTTRQSAGSSFSPMSVEIRSIERIHYLCIFEAKLGLFSLKLASSKNDGKDFEYTRLIFALGILLHPNSI